MSESKFLSLQKFIKRHFASMPIYFVSKDKLIKNALSYTKSINLVSIDITPMGTYIQICINRG